MAHTEQQNRSGDYDPVSGAGIPFIRNSEYSTENPRQNAELLMKMLSTERPVEIPQNIHQLSRTGLIFILKKPLINTVEAVYYLHGEMGPEAYRDLVDKARELGIIDESYKLGIALNHSRISNRHSKKASMRAIGPERVRHIKD